MKISDAGAHGAIVLFDFEAAFASISQSFLLDMLQSVGLPEEVLQVVRALYWQCRCVVKMGGSTFPGFNMSSGVRQGCPLSPLLFVLTVDVSFALWLIAPLLTPSFAPSRTMSAWPFPRPLVTSPGSSRSTLTLRDFLAFGSICTRLWLSHFGRTHSMRQGLSSLSTPLKCGTWTLPSKARTLDSPLVRKGSVASGEKHSTGSKTGL